jgi:DNA-directed RNA polymerase alpha subunit
VNERRHRDQGGQDLELSVRSANVAKRVGAATVGELARFTVEEILESKCFGETSLREIQEALARRGLRLGMTAEQQRGLPGLQAKIVRQSQAGAAQPAVEAEDEGDCCGHCGDTARKLRERGDLERKLNLSLAELELSVRATNCLESGGIVTVRDLVVWTPEELLQVRRLTKPMLDDVTTRLAAHGLRLGTALSAERAH